MPLSNESTYTINDIYALPEGERAELIDGKLYMMAPPSRLHQELVGELFTVIRNHIGKNGGSCKAYIAPFAVFLNENEKNYVEPDISVICDINKLNDKGCQGAPDWIIEIVSPSSQRMDYQIKLFKYRTAGVKEYWIVNPDTCTVTVYGFDNDFNSGQLSPLPGLHDSNARNNSGEQRNNSVLPIHLHTSCFHAEFVRSACCHSTASGLPSKYI